MQTILRFLSNYEVLFYFLLAIAVILSLRKVLKAWKQWRSAVFGIEKETSQRVFNQGMTILILCGLFGLSLFVVNTFITPSVPGVQIVGTPTVDLTQQPTATIDVNSLITQTTSGLIPTLVSFFSSGCIPDQIGWTSPTDGERISGIVILRGTVNVTDLGMYKYDYSPYGSDAWTTIAAGGSKIVDQPLGGNWDTSDLTPGDYLLRLVVYDHQNNQLPECTIKISITAP
ncbi:MAG: hypothetical protein AB9897_09550 [Anaerolineaceae bacterium]